MANKKVIYSVAIIIIYILGILTFSIYKTKTDIPVEIKNSQFNDESIEKMLNNINVMKGNKNDTKIDIDTIINQNTGNKRAYLLMLTSNENDNDEKIDIYYFCISAIVHRLLHHPKYKTKLEDVDVVVMVNEYVANWKIIELYKLGAVIKMVKNIDIKEIAVEHEKWKNCFTKLNMFKMTEYDTIVYLDADLLILSNIDDLFKMADEERKKTNKKEFFGSVTDGGYGELKTEDTGMFNAGLMILTPDENLYNEIMKIIPNTDKYDTSSMEQGFLSYYYSDENNEFGKVRYHIPPEYNAQWFSEEHTKYINDVKIIHQKIFTHDLQPNMEVQKLILESIFEWMTFDIMKIN